MFLINRYTYEAEEKFGEVVKKDIQGCKQYGFTKSGKLKWIFIDNDSEQNVRECFYDENDLLTSFVMYTEDKTFNKKSNERYVLKRTLKVEPAYESELPTTIKELELLQQNIWLEIEDSSGINYSHLGQSIGGDLILQKLKRRK